MLFARVCIDEYNLALTSVAREGKRVVAYNLVVACVVFTYDGECMLVDKHIDDAHHGWVYVIDQRVVAKAQAWDGCIHLGLVGSPFDASIATVGVL